MNDFMLGGFAIAAGVMTVLVSIYCAIEGFIEVRQLEKRVDELQHEINILKMRSP